MTHRNRLFEPLDYVETSRSKATPTLPPAPPTWHRFLGLLSATLLVAPVIFLLVVWPLSPMLAKLLIAFRGGF